MDVWGYRLAHMMLQKISSICIYIYRFIYTFPSALRSRWFYTITITIRTKKTVHIKYSESKWQYLGSGPQTGNSHLFQGICHFLVRHPWNKPGICHCYKQYLYTEVHLNSCRGGRRLLGSQSQTIHLWSKLIWPYHTLTTKLLGLMAGGWLYEVCFITFSWTLTTHQAHWLQTWALAETTSSVFWCPWCHQRIPRQTSRSYFRLYWTAVGAHMVNFRIFLNLKSNNPNNPKSTLVMSGDSGYLPICAVLFYHNFSLKYPKQHIADCAVKPRTQLAKTLPETNKNAPTVGRFRPQNSETSGRFPKQSILSRWYVSLRGSHLPQVYGGNTMVRYETYRTNTHQSYPWIPSWFACKPELPHFCLLSSSSSST